MSLAVSDLGSGLFSIAGAGVVDNGNGTFTITDTGVTDNGNGTFTITDTSGPSAVLPIYVTASAGPLITVTAH